MFQVTINILMLLRSTNVPGEIIGDVGMIGSVLVLESPSSRDPSE